MLSQFFSNRCNCRELGKTIIVADIAQYSEYPHRREVLFDVNVTFRLKSIQRLTQIWLVKINATNEGREMLEIL